MLHQATISCCTSNLNPPGKGVSFMQNKVEWHYKSPNAEQLAQAIEEIEAAYA